MHFKDMNPKIGSILIVGAGPTGLTLACELARRGINFRIIDKSTTHFKGSRAKGLQPRTLEVLEDIGVIEEILEASDVFPTFRTYNKKEILADRTLFELLSYAAPEVDPATPYPAPRVIPQWKTEDILRRKLAKYGHAVELGITLLRIEQQNELIEVRIEHQNQTERLFFDYVIGADGGSSTVRKYLNIGFEGETYESERTLIGDVKALNADRKFCNLYTTGDVKNRVTLWPLPGTADFQFIATMSADEVPEMNMASLQEILEKRSGRTDLRITAVSWLSLYKVNVRMASQFRKGNVFLAGDAAHIHSSAGGQGLNTGIQDGYNLGWKLALALSSGSTQLLDSYEQERLPVAAKILGLTTMLHGRQFKNATVPLNTPNESSPEIFQLSLNYRGGPLSFHDFPLEIALQAGDRAPDAIIANTSGVLSRLFLLYQGSHFTLLTFGKKNDNWLRKIKERYENKVHVYRVTNPGEAVAEFCITDVYGTIQKNYGLSNLECADLAILIRPDNYIGIISYGDSGYFNQYFKFLDEDDESVNIGRQ